MGDNAIKESFARVKHDFIEQEKRISAIKEELNSLKEQVVNYIPELLKQNNQILKRLEVLENAILKKQDPLKEKILLKYNKKKKEVIKQKILEIASTKEVTLNELRETLVNDLKYCSRASFYRYFEEMKKAGIVGTASINGNVLVSVLVK